MIKLIFAALLSSAVAQTAQSASYLIFSSQAACLARSQQMCQAMGCDGVHTIYWWDCTTGPLNSGLVGPNAVPQGSYAMRVDSAGTFGPTASNSVSNGTQGLTAQEQSKLATWPQVSPLVPAQAVIGQSQAVGH